jgi:hypothetical protein
LAYIWSIIKNKTMKTIKNIFWELTGFTASLGIALGMIIFAIIANVYYYRKWIIVSTIVYFGVKSYFYGR